MGELKLAEWNQLPRFVFSINIGVEVFEKQYPQFRMQAHGDVFNGIATVSSMVATEKSIFQGAVQRKFVHEKVVFFV